MIERAKLEMYAYTALRIVVGFMFMWHGIQKLFGVFAPHTPPVGSQIWIGGVIELATGVLVGLGLFTRPAAFLASGMMAVAYIQFHWKGALDSKFLPVVNGGELAVVYCFVFLLFCVRGAGPVSVDHRLGRSGA